MRDERRIAESTELAGVLHQLAGVGLTVSPEAGADLPQPMDQAADAEGLLRPPGRARLLTGRPAFRYGGLVRVGVGGSALRLSSVLRLVLATALLLPAVGLTLLAITVISYSWQGEHDSGPLVYIVVGLIYLAVAGILGGGALLAILGLRLWQGLTVLAIVSSALVFVPYEPLIGMSLVANAAIALLAVAFWIALLYTVRGRSNAGRSL